MFQWIISLEWKKLRGISTYGMSKEQIVIIKSLIEAFRGKNTFVPQKLTAEQYQLIGKIAVELSKDE